uniref:Uncharacterized protein n=1 Tax=viral metagenome TaxID=1070528 RepID=A0A6H2A0D3_9ZZZZ
MDNAIQKTPEEIEKLQMEYMELISRFHNSTKLPCLYCSKPTIMLDGTAKYICQSSCDNMKQYNKALNDYEEYIINALGIKDLINDLR